MLLTSCECAHFAQKQLNQILSLDSVEKIPSQKMQDTSEEFPGELSRSLNFIDYALQRVGST